MSPNFPAARETGTVPDGCAVLLLIPSGASPDRWLYLLDSSEAERLRAFRHSADRNRFAWGVIGLKHLVAQVVGVAPEGVAVDRACGQCPTQHGRPMLRGVRGHVSVSHSGEWVMVAVAGSPIGVDVQEIVPSIVEVEHDLYSEKEKEKEAYEGRRHIHPRSREVALTRSWARKEALLKAWGMGIDQGLNTVTATDVAWGPPSLPVRWQVKDIPVDSDHCGAAAIEFPRDAPAAEPVIELWDRD